MELREHSTTLDLQSLFNMQLISFSPVSDVITRDKRLEEMIQTS